MRIASAKLPALIAVSCLHLTSANAQSALLEVQGLFGECIPQFASVTDSLYLYLTPNLEADARRIEYGENWHIPYIKSSGQTRVLSFGEVKALATEELEQCTISNSGRSPTILPGQTAIYLHDIAEGVSQVRIGEVECQMFIGDDEIVERPSVQSWIKVLYADGSSPGWLHNDGTQTKIVGVRC
jgi:hypothetical protein